jgi:tape measure domain-containing protein
MAAIKSNDLLDFDGTERELARLEKMFLALGEKMVGLFNKTAEAQDKAIDGAKRLQQALQSVNVKGPGAGGSIGSIGKEMEASIASIERYAATLKTMSDFESISQLSIRELKDGVAALRKQYDELKPSADNFAKDQQEIAAKTNVATQQLARLEAEMKAVNTTVKATSRVMKEVKKSVDDAEGSYNKLSKQTAELKKELKALPNAFNAVTGEINQANKQAVIWQKTIERNEAALRKMDSSMGNFHRNVGNYSSAFSGLNLSISGLIAPILGVSTAYEALHKSVQIIDELTRVKLGLEAVSSSSEQVTRRWQFLSDLADKTGQDIGKLSSVYVSFAGATKDTALEGAAGDKIFRSFSNAFSALGKSSEVAERGLYAVQQMISKGKVSSEELNQQLAEALPGANRILAQSLKLSTAELADMMKKGKILTVDVLPGMAAAIEKLYGASAQKNVNTITGSWTRLTTQFKLFLDDLNKDNAVSGFFARLNNGLADAARNMRALLNNTPEVAKRAGVIMQNQSPGMKALGGFVPGIRQGAAAYNASQQIGLESAANSKMVADVQAVSSSSKRAAILRKEEEDLKKLTRAYHDYKNQTSDSVIATEEMRTKTVALFGAMDQQRALVKSLKEAEVERLKVQKEEAGIAGRGTGAPAGDGEDKTKKALSAFEKLEKEVSKLRNILVDEALADFKNGEKEFSPSEKSLKKWKELYDLMSKVAFTTGQNIPKEIEELNAKLTNQPEDIASSIKLEKIKDPKAPKVESPQDLTKYVAVLETQEKEMQDLVARLATGSLRKFSDYYASELTKQLAVIQQLEQEAALAKTDQEKQGVTERLQLAKQEYDEKIRLAREEVAAKKELQGELFNLAQESASAIFQMISDQRQADRESLQMQMEHELSLVQGNEAAQERIKKDYAKKDLELRQKQARLEKAQAAFSIGISTARAVVNALATGGPPWIGIALAAIVGAMGAIQLAAVLAKPLPQFYKGTDNAPEGPAWVAERGPEIHESKGRMTLIPNKTVMPLSKGDKIYTAAETRAILSNMDRKDAVNKMIERGVVSRNKREEIARLQGSMMVVSQQKIDYDKLASSFGKELDKRPVNQTLVDEQGIRRRHIRQNSTITYNNSRFSLK